jgi:PKHD-type hydroxylase
MKEKQIQNSFFYFEGDKLNSWASMVNVFTRKECKKIIEFGEKEIGFYKGVIQGEIDGFSEREEYKEYRDSEVCFIYPHEDTDWIFERIAFHITNLNQEYFKFDLFGMSEGIQLTKYIAPSGKYKKHIDLGYSKSIRKLSVTVQLSDEDEYEGGELNLYLDEIPVVMQKAQGSMSAFPSFVMHEVKPVTKGTRYSLVVWVTGPQFR